MYKPWENKEHKLHLAKTDEERETEKQNKIKHLTCESAFVCSLRTNNNNNNNNYGLLICTFNEKLFLSVLSILKWAEFWSILA